MGEQVSPRTGAEAARSGALRWSVDVVQEAVKDALDRQSKTGGSVHSWSRTRFCCECSRSRSLRQASWPDFFDPFYRLLAISRLCQLATKRTYLTWAATPAARVPNSLAAWRVALRENTHRSPDQTRPATATIRHRRLTMRRRTFCSSVPYWMVCRPSLIISPLCGCLQQRFAR
jgi:hypothetical protein